MYHICTSHNDLSSRWPPASISTTLTYCESLGLAQIPEAAARLFYRFGSVHGLASAEAKKTLLVLLQIAQTPLQEGRNDWVAFSPPTHTPLFGETENEAQAQVSNQQHDATPAQEEQNAAQNAARDDGVLTHLVERQEANELQESADVARIDHETSSLREQVQEQHLQEQQTAAATTTQQGVLQGQQRAIESLQAQQQQQNSLLEQILQQISSPTDSSAPAPVFTTVPQQTPPPSEGSPITTEPVPGTQGAQVSGMTPPDTTIL